MATRENGYYWVRERQGEDEKVGHWVDCEWWFEATEYTYKDDQLAEINERRISPGPSSSRTTEG